MKIVLCGPPSTGKTCLREALKQALYKRTGNNPYPYCLPANPDGDGAWYLPTAWQFPHEARRWREIDKKPFAQDFIERTARNVKDCQLPLVIIDVGGKPLPDNVEICHAATHAVILARDNAGLEEWRGFCQVAELTIVAEILSDREAKEDRVDRDGVDGILRGMVHRLDRSEPAIERPMVQALAVHIVTLLGLPHAGPSSDSDEPFLMTPGALGAGFVVLSVGFGRPATNAEIVPAALRRLDQLDLPRGQVALFDGPVSVPAAAALACQVLEKFEAVGFFDPKLNQFIISGARGDSTLRPGSMVTVAEQVGAVQPVSVPSDEIFFVRKAEETSSGVRVEIGFGSVAAENFDLVLAALNSLNKLTIAPAFGLLFDGKVSVIVAAALACASAKMYRYVAFLDPKINRYLVCASRDAAFPVGAVV